MPAKSHGHPPPAGVVVIMTPSSAEVAWTPEHTLSGATYSVYGLAGNRVVFLGETAGSKLSAPLGYQMYGVAVGKVGGLIGWAKFCVNVNAGHLPPTVTVTIPCSGGA